MARTTSGSTTAMTLSRTSTVAVLLALASTAEAFTAPHLSSKQSAFSATRYSTSRPHHQRRYAAASVSSDGVLEEDSIITPKGYGFSCPADRILKESSRNSGFYRADANDEVIDVMEAITTGPADVALVYKKDDNDNSKLMGLFTETDYIRFSIARGLQSSNEMESASFLVSKVENFVSPVADLLTIRSDETANVAVAAMKTAGVRHLIVTDVVSSNRRLTPESSVLGVISMQDVMSVIQKDERLSLQSLQEKYPNIPSPLERMREDMMRQANIAADNPETAKQDILKVGTLVLSGSVLAAFFTNSEWLHNHAEAVMIGIFVLGYLGIILEEVFEFNKAGVALLMSTALWVTYADFFNSSNGASATVLAQLGEQLSEVSEICFFLLAASAIVEVVDAHQGFKVVTNQIQTKSKKSLFWVIGFLTFFLSAVLNNLTVTIVMVSLLRKLIPDDEDRRRFGAMVVVAANAGGVWTPIGDVTTTMLWMDNQLSTIPTVTQLFLPSVVCLVGSLAFLVNDIEEDDSLSSLPEATPLSPRGKLVFYSGIAALLSVPVFSELTGLPPYLAMLTGLGAMWTLTDIIHMEDSDENLKVPAALSKLDTSGILFFLGILMSIGVLDKSGLLKELAVYLSNNLPSLDIIATVIGLASALIDNVPLVAATMGMYDLTEYGTDDRLWQLIALCAGTGGSILVIGSASGVALMGLEKVDFIWYAKKVSLGAAVGYFAGIATYLAQNAILTGGFMPSLPQVAAAGDMASQMMNSM